MTHSPHQKINNMDIHYNYCDKCTGKIVMHAFSNGECTKCGKEISTYHTPCDLVCSKCSNEKDLCMSCGDKLKPIKILKVDPIPMELQIEEYNKNHPEQHTSIVEMTANEILDKYKGYLEPTQKELLTGYSAADEWAEHMENYIEHINEDKQSLEALILSWRMKLKEKCEEKASKLNQVSAWHQHDDEEFRIIKEACFIPLKEFDEHFAIVAQKQGEI